MRILFLACLASTLLLLTPALHAQGDPAPDCNNNGQADDLDLAQGLSADCDGNSIPDECDIAAAPLADCDQNGLLDICEPVGAVSLSGVQNGQIALSGDTMLVSEGDPFPEPGEVPDGEPAAPRMVEVYQRSGTQWVLQGTLTPADGNTDDGFGLSLALDGDTAAVGAPGANGTEGSVYLFQRTGTTWNQVEILTAQNPLAEDYYGSSVDVRGSNVIVGAPQSREIEIEFGPSGFAEMWNSSAGTWTRTAHVSESGLLGGGEENGTSVALGDGGWAFVGAPSFGANVGRVHAYIQVAGSWQLAAGFTASDAAQGTLFGTQLASQGSTLLVVADRSPDVVSGDVGAVYTYNRTGTTWTQVNRMISPLGSNNTNSYGASLSLAGEQLAVGEPNINNQRGSVHLYSRSGAGWQLRDSLRPGSIVNGDNYGSGAATNGTWVGAIAGGIPGSFITHAEFTEDCDGNNVDDRCDLTAGTHLDCNGNSIPDACDISSGASQDCDGDGIPDSCNLSDGTPDCNINGVPDSCDISQGTSLDCNGDSIPDDCQQDCNENGVPDDCDLTNGTADCNGNLIPDSCDIAVGFSQDCDGNTIPDSCDLSSGAADCDGDGLQDVCAISQGADDCDLDGVPDSCELDASPSLDCNSNAVLDSCDIDQTFSQDCDGNSIPDECQVSSGFSEDCNTNGIPDECEQPNLVDTTPPQIVGTPDNMIASADSGSCSTAMSWIAPAATDNCGPAPLVVPSHTSGAQFEVGTTTVTFDAVDQHGNPASTSFTITITDDELPTLTGTPASMSVTADPGLCSAMPAWTPPTSADNCPGQTVEASHAPGFAFPVGTTEVSYTVTDASSNTASTSFSVTVTDDQAPVYTDAPQSQDLSSDPGSCGAVATWGAHTTSDNCAVTTDISTASSGDFFELGTTTVTMTLTDENNQQTIHEFTITVTDTEPPVITDMPASMTQSAELGLCSASMTWTPPNTSDNCPGAALSSTHQPGDSFPVGDTTVTYTSDDANGLSTSSSFVITINDTENPIFDSAPANIQLNTDPGSCDAITTWAEPEVSDNCGSVPLLGGTHLSGSAFPLGETTVTYTAEDQHGNSSQHSFTVTISDNEPPTLSNMPLSFTVTNDANECGATVTWQEPGSADNCSIAGTDTDVLNGSFLPVGDTLVTYATTDLSGNLTTAAFTVTVLDSQAPSFKTAPASTTTTTDSGLCGATVMWDTPSIFENCTDYTLGTTHNSGDFFQKGTTDVTMTASDSHGNSTTHSFQVTVNDAETPTISGTPASMSMSSDQGSCGAVVSWTPPTSADNCPGDVLTSSHLPGDFFGIGSTTVSFSVTDASGNSHGTSFTVDVADNELPTFSGAPISQSLSTDPGSCGAIATWAPHTSDDNCGVDSDTSTASSGDFFELGNTTVTMTLVDVHGNQATHEFTITVTDTEDPMLHDVPASMTQTAEAGSCGASISWTPPTTTDNCPNPSLSSTHQPGDTFEVGTTTVTYISNDANGLSSSASFDVTVTDNELPTFDLAPGDIALANDPGSCGAVATWDAPLTSDNCGILESSSTHMSGMEFPVGETTVTMTLIDLHQNSSTHQFTVTVTDIDAPTLSGMPSSMTATNDPDQCGAMMGWSDPSSSDNCPGESTSSTHSPGEFFAVGTTTVGYTVTDASGNSTDYSFDVTVTDDQAPQFDSAPSDFTLNSLPGECGATAVWNEVLSSDNCGTTTLTSSAASGDTFNVGTTIVTMGLVDSSGNTSEHTFTVSVIDEEDPVLANLPGDMVLDTDPGECGATVTWTPPTASDNCALGEYVASHSPGDYFAVGTTSVTYTQSDINGNIVSGGFNVTVSDNEGPTITTSGDITEAAPAGTCTTTLTIATPSISDNCTAIDLYNNLNGTDDASGTFEYGTTTILWTGIDNHGNTSEVTQTVTITVPEADCNANGSPDVCDLAAGTSEDCDGNGVPDECDVDCNGNGTPDACDLASGSSNDCNGNSVPDECDLDNQDSLDTNANSIPDECEPTFLRGDANEDGGVDIADAIFMLYSLMLGGTPSSCTDATDANDDGAHDISDIIFVLNYQFQNGSAPPAPGPSQCGIDMTPDDGLGCDSYGGCP